MAQHNFLNTLESSITTPVSGKSGFFFNENGYPKYKDSAGNVRDFPGSFTWKGDYSALTSYVVNDVSFYDNSSYICTVATSGNLPTDTDYWHPLAIKGINNGEQ